MFKIGKPTGFTLLSVLLALLIIFILTGYYFRRGGSNVEQQLSLYETSMDRSKAVACQANRQVIETNIQAWMVTHPGETPTLEKLSQAGYSIPRCPEGGTYSITPEGQVVCDRHSKAQVPRTP